MKIDVEPTREERQQGTASALLPGKGSASPNLFYSANAPGYMLMWRLSGERLAELSSNIPLQARLGKVLHTVKRAGTYAAKVHLKNYTKSMYERVLFNRQENVSSRAKSPNSL